MDSSSGPGSWSKDSDLKNLDWPEYDSDEDNEVGRALAVSLLGECKAPGCNRPRARNPRTGQTHQYCSLRCSRHQEVDCDS